MRTSITLSDLNRDTLVLQARILNISLSRHINNILEQHIITELSSVEEVIQKLTSG